MAEFILYFILLLPVYGILIWTYFDPEESMLFAQRWKYNEEPEFSDAAIAYTKFAALSAIILISLLFFGMFLSYSMRILLVVAFIGYIIYAVLKIRKRILSE